MCPLWLYNQCDMSDVSEANEVVNTFDVTDLHI